MCVNTGVQKCTKMKLKAIKLNKAIIFLSKNRKLNIMDLTTSKFNEIVNNVYFFFRHIKIT